MFTANNYYLCTDIDKDGNYMIVASLPIVGNEDIIDGIRRRLPRTSIIPIGRTESIIDIISAVRNRGGRTGWDNVVSEGQPGGYGRDASLHLGPQSESGGDRQEAGGNNETQAETAEPEEGYGLNGEASADAAELAAYDAGRMSLAERAAQAVAAMSAKNRADVEARREAQRMDERNGTEVVRFIDFLRRGRLEQDESRYFHVGETGDILNEHGISGKITIGTFAVNSHHNEDADHLDENDWVEVIEKINEPVAIKEYGDKGNSYGIYTIVEKNGKNICVGVDVNSVGRDVNITNIRTAFARDIANALNERLVYPHSRTELETAIRELSLRHNREVYPEQPFDAANVGNNSDIDRENEENVSGEPEEGYGLNGEASADAAELAAYDAGRMSLAERAAQAVAAMSAKNRADVEARREAVKALGGNLQKLRQAMARQREYDKGTVDAIVRQARIMLEGGMLDGMTRGEVKKLLSKA